MNLTKFYFNQPALGVQGRVWDFFDSKFEQGRSAEVTKVSIKTEG